MCRLSDRCNVVPSAVATIFIKRIVTQQSKDASFVLMLFQIAFAIATDQTAFRSTYSFIIHRLTTEYRNVNYEKAFYTSSLPRPTLFLNDLVPVPLNTFITHCFHLLTNRPKCLVEPCYNMAWLRKAKLRTI